MTTLYESTTDNGVFSIEEYHGEYFISHAWTPTDPGPRDTIPITLSELESAVRALREATTPIHSDRQNVLVFRPVRRIREFVG